MNVRCQSKSLLENEDTGLRGPTFTNTSDDIVMLSLQCFKPAYPRPTHRFDRTVVRSWPHLVLFFTIALSRAGIPSTRIAYLPWIDSLSGFALPVSAVQ